MEKFWSISCNNNYFITNPALTLAQYCNIVISISHCIFKIYPDHICDFFLIMNHGKILSNIDASLFRRLISRLIYQNFWFITYLPLNFQENIGNQIIIFHSYIGKTSFKMNRLLYKYKAILFFYLRNNFIILNFFK